MKENDYYLPEVVKEKNRLKNILDQILREHSRPHESEGVYATNMSLLLEEVARDLKTQ